jgi:putative peptidoglycan lipid II flippase
LAGLLLGVLVWLIRESIVNALAPGLVGQIKTDSANALSWSAVVLPLAMLAALWVTRLQHERDFVGMYAGNLLVNVALVLGLFAVSKNLSPSVSALNLLGICLMLAMLARLAWLSWRLPIVPAPVVAEIRADLPPAGVWLWAALSSGLLLGIQCR